MDIEQIRTYALGKPSVTEGFPFGTDVLVFKVHEKIFLLLSLDTPEPQLNVKCDPERAICLRDEFPDSVFPGYHMNKKHWNTILINGRMNRQAILDQIDHSYELVARTSAPKRKG